MEREGRTVRRRRDRRVAALLCGIAAIVALSAAVAHASTWEIGDVFAGGGTQGGGAGTPPPSYRIFDNGGTFKEEVSKSGISGVATGCAFDANDDLYGTVLEANQVIKFANAHPHPDVQTIFGPPGDTTESIVFDAEGNFYVTHPDGDKDIIKYDPAGNVLDRYDVQTELIGSDWADLAVDQRTIFYTSEGPTIFRYDVATHTQLPPFATGIGSNSFGLRLLPPGDGSGGLLVANNTDIKRLDGSGNVVQTYDAPGQDDWFALNLDPNGTSFWSAGVNSLNVFRFDIATGAIEVGPIVGHPPGFRIQVGGLCVLGEPTAAIPPPSGAAGPPLTFDITGRKKQKIAGPQVKPGNHKAKNANRKLVSVKVTCQNKPCTVDVKGKVKVQGEKVKLKGPQVSLQPGETKRVRLSAKKPQLAGVKAALKEGGRGRVKVNGTATASDGEKAQDSFKVKLRG